MQTNIEDMRWVCLCQYNVYVDDTCISITTIRIVIKFSYKTPYFLTYSKCHRIYVYYIFSYKSVAQNYMETNVESFLLTELVFSSQRVTPAKVFSFINCSICLQLQCNEREKKFAFQIVLTLLFIVKATLMEHNAYNEYLILLMF